MTMRALKKAVASADGAASVAGGKGVGTKATIKAGGRKRKAGDGDEQGGEGEARAVEGKKGGGRGRKAKKDDSVVWEGEGESF